MSALADEMGLSICPTSDATRDESRALLLVSSPATTSPKRRQIFILLIFPIFYLCLLLKKQLITEQTVNNMLSWRNSGFSVNATV